MTAVTSEIEDLLSAGAVLPLDISGAGTSATGGAGEHAVPLTARTYRHPVLGDQPVVRLVPAELGDGEDTAMAFLGLERAADPVLVGLGQRQSLGFPEWVLVRHPDDGHHALAIVPELKRVARQARSKPKTAVDEYHALAQRLARSVPHFLPTFYEQAGRVFLGLEEKGYAGQMFGRARRAEAEHGLGTEPDRIDSVYLEFALAGALPATALAGYAKELANRLPADQALRRFCRLCVRTTSAGIVPSVQTANALRRLVRAADKSGNSRADGGVRPGQALERAYLIEMLDLPATAQAAIGWWQAYLPALVALAETDRSVRGALLNLMPPNDPDGEVLPAWLEVLTATGAIDGLVDLRLPVAERPTDGSAGWLRRFLKVRHRRAYQYPGRSPALYGLVERMADALRAELAAEDGTTIDASHDIDLIDLMLSLDLPVTVPGALVRITGWADGAGQRDLLALAGEARFRKALHGALDRCDDEAGHRAMRRLAGSPGGRPLLTGWVRNQAAALGARGLPRLAEAGTLLASLPAEALVLAPEEVATAARTDLTDAVLRSLRGGLLEELGWPAWDEAIGDVVDPSAGHTVLVLADAWPYLIVAGPTRARVIDADGTVLTHDLRIPQGDLWGQPGFHFVDGELLVYWRSNQRHGSLLGYWHSAPDQVRPMAGDHNQYHPRRDVSSLPLPGGGRTTGAGVLHVGDTEVPDDQDVISDGTSYWVRRPARGGEAAQWYEYDPTTGEYGRQGLPGQLADALRTAPAGSTLSDVRSWLRPAPSDRATPLGVPVDGLLGWRLVRLPDGSYRGQDLAGRTVTTNRGVPVGALRLPGDDRLRILLEDLRLADPDGIVITRPTISRSPVRCTRAGILLPPQWHLHQLRPRDPQGSAALRRIDRDTVATLLKSADRPKELPELIRSTLPQITDDVLVAGVAEVLWFAATSQSTLRGLAERLAAALAQEVPEENPSGPSDAALRTALNGFADVYYWRAQEHLDHAFRQLRTMRGAMDRSEADPGVGLHLEGPELSHSIVDLPALLGWCTGIAYRAVAATTPAQEREVLRALLTELDGLGLVTAAEATRWRRIRLHLPDRNLPSGSGGRPHQHRALLPLSGGRFIAVLDHVATTFTGVELGGLYHDPSEKFAVPAPYTVLASTPVGDARPAGWMAGFLAEWARRGPLPWRPAAADEFAERTGVSRAAARLVLAGLFRVNSAEPMPAEVRETLGLKPTEVTLARSQLTGIDGDVRRAVVTALVPDDPTRLWTDGPDVAAAAQVWNDRVGRRPTIPEELLADALRSVRLTWSVDWALAGLLEPDLSPELRNDLAWGLKQNQFVQRDASAVGFTAATLVGAVGTAAWVAHRVPAGDPVRAALPAALVAVRDRLANPELMLTFDWYVRLDAFRKVAGAPSQTGDGWERYGAVVLATHGDRSHPAIRVALLDDSGDDPYLPVLRGGAQRMSDMEVALRTARDPWFAALLADPGEPAAGTRDPDGTWWPQDPSRSVPDLVAEVVAEYGLSADAAALYLMLLAMPDPTDRNVARWTGWKPARLRSGRTELAGTELVIQASRSRAGRALFLPGAWLEQRSPRLPIEQWKIPLFAVPGQPDVPLGLGVPFAPAPEIYRRAWQRIRDGGGPRLEQLQTPRTRKPRNP
ncbi:DNA-binding protein [Plantactinospora sp. S1510]|uniref:DNA-binding protein n=1 Tax=Plantactinospora alkalitolerans TaxID=2789879 RepID=A0ABS0H2J8_9ACTN|nr:DNA-binding protein [Plantactinospora alkalitolerans]MBF9132428.1 DNA-binding protein [Plantactinospora alkalitolerans]